MVASDRVGGNDGTLDGDPTWRSSGGKIGGALEFDGTGDYVQIEGYKGIRATLSASPALTLASSATCFSRTAIRSSRCFSCSSSLAMR